jgi:hypothetical protein
LRSVATTHALVATLSTDLGRALYIASSITTTARLIVSALCDMSCATTDALIAVTGTVAPSVAAIDGSRSPDHLADEVTPAQPQERG